MAFVYVQDNTPVDAETYDKVNEVLRVHGDPPEGLILHSASPTESGMLIVDVWESREAQERFRDERLMPAIQQVVGDAAAQGEPQVKVAEIHDLVMP